jgi:hypothetical protein
MPTALSRLHTVTIACIKWWVPNFNPGLSIYIVSFHQQLPVNLSDCLKISKSAWYLHQSAIKQKLQCEGCTDVAWSFEQNDEQSHKLKIVMKHGFISVIWTTDPYVQSLCFTVAEEFSFSRIWTKHMELAYSYTLHHMMSGEAYVEV